MNIIECLNDENILQPYIGDDQASWHNWFAALRCVYGLPIAKKRRDLVRQCTGRDPLLMPDQGFSEALFLTGRRSGKSRMAAVIAAFEAAMAGGDAKLAKGERGVVAVCAPTKQQARVVKSYIRGCFESRLLEPLVLIDTQEGFNLSNQVKIQVLAGDWRTIRGYTMLAAIVDEAAFFGYDAESKVKSDSELMRAIKPGLATTGGKLIAISSPYARKGWCYSTHQRNFGNDKGKTLVWNCPSRTMNPKLPQAVVDDALAEDLQAAKAEYLGEFRDDVSSYLDRELIERLVVRGRDSLLHNPRLHYSAFADLSGGRSDSAALCIAHMEGPKVVVDCLYVWAAPFNPHQVVMNMAKILRRHDLRRVVGDNYAAEFVSRAFEAEGISYRQSDKPKSELYGELLPRLCSGEIELPDNDSLVNQLAGLERRTRSGGRDVIDHPPGGHDDLANAVAGVADVTATKRLRIGAL